MCFEMAPVTERRKLHNLRQSIDMLGESAQREAFVRAARKFGPDSPRLAEIDNRLGELLIRTSEIKSRPSFDGIIAGLPEKNRAVLEMLERRMTLQQIADFYGQTRGSIHSIETRALRRLSDALAICGPISEATFQAHEYLFAMMGYQTRPIQAPVPTVPGLDPTILGRKTVEFLDLSIRSQNRVPEYMAQLLAKTEAELKKVPGLGIGSTTEIVIELRTKGLNLGMLDATLVNILFSKPLTAIPLESRMALLVAVLNG